MTLARSFSILPILEEIRIMSNRNAFCVLAVWVLLTCKTVMAATLAIGSANGVAGTDVTIDVSGGGLNGATSWGFDLGYDPTVVSYVSIAKGTAMTDWSTLAASELATGVLRIGAFAGQGTPLDGTDQTICQLVLHLNGAAGSETTLTVANRTDALSAATVSPGSVSIQSAIGTDPTLSIGGASGSVGSDIVIPVVADNLNGATSWGFDLTFDATHLSFVSFQHGTATADWSTITGSELSPGVLRVGGFAGTGTPITGIRQEIGRLTLHIDSAEGAPFALQPSGLVDGLANCQTVAGRVSVGGPSEVSLYLQPQQMEAPTGRMVSIPVWLDAGNKVVGAASGELTFDPSVLQFVSGVVDYNAFPGRAGYVALQSHNSGTIHFEASSALGISGSHVRVATLLFSVLGMGATDLVLPVDQSSVENESGAGLSVGTRGMHLTLFDPADIPSGWIYNPSNAHLYRLLPYSSWSQAEQTAESMDAHLVTVNDAAENAWLVSRFAGVDLGGADSMWIGLSEKADAAQFAWTDGTSPGYTAWYSGQPDSQGWESCVRWFNSSGSVAAGQWQASVGDVPLPAIIEKDFPIRVMPPVAPSYQQQPYLIPGQTSVIQFSANIALTGEAYDVSLVPVKGGDEINLGVVWSPSETTDPNVNITRTMNVSVPKGLPAGYYRLKVVSDWALQHPAEFPTPYADESAPIRVIPESAADASWMLYR